MSEPLLDVRDLKVYFDTDEGVVQAVDGVSFHINRGEILGIVGESGCGKSVTAMTIMKLLAMPPARIVSGTIRFEDMDLVAANEAQMCLIRSKHIGMVFQEPMTSLNPVLTIGDQVSEACRLHEGLTKKQALGRAIEMLNLVNIPRPEKRINDYPHQFSGGMRQRVMIAMALSCGPKLLIADEPTTALDVTIQAQILDLLHDLKERMNMAIMLITHAMGVVAESTQRVIVMYAGQVVEEALVEDLFAHPQHPYTQGLIRSIPRIDLLSTKKTRLSTIVGSVPKLIGFDEGCRFAPRCPSANAVCRSITPISRETTAGHRVACHLVSV